MSDTSEPLEYFSLTNKEPVFQCSVFQVQKCQAQTPDKKHALDVFTLRCTDWVNVIPVTANKKVVLIEQHRFGTDSHILEIPGGSVGRGEKDATLAAVRELGEETGLTSQRFLALPGFYPNPAIQGNRMCYFIALDVQPLTEPLEHFDPFEKIKLHYVDLKEAIHMARTGQISHALSALGLLLAEPYIS